jgi:uncharacterized membrane protein (DUF2068 family)
MSMPPPQRKSRLLRLIAVERLLRGALLIAAGVYLVTHSRTDLGRVADHIMRAVELDPRRPFLHHLVLRLHDLHAGVVLLTGLAALGYGALEVVEGYGLWRDRVWAEVLTVVATALLVPLEVYEVVRSPSLVKAAGIAVNVAIVAYLAVRLRRRRGRA